MTDANTAGRRLVAAMTLLFLAACPPASDVPDAGGADAGGARDGGLVVDAGLDAGTAPDAADRDSGAFDAGLSLDGGDDGGVDAGPPREFGLEIREPNATCRLEGAAPTGVPSLVAEAAFSSLSFDRPVQLMPVPGAARLLVVERGGRVWASDDDDQADSKTLVLDLTGVVMDEPAQGLVGAALHPDYPADARLFVTYVADAPRRVVLAQLPVDTTALFADASLLVELLSVEHATGPDVGPPVFLADGTLIVPVGDGGDGPAAADLASLSGKVLRIDVEGAPPYGIPADNPFAALAGARGEVFARGLASPLGCAVDDITDQLYCADRGALAWELNAIVGGGDYGWPARDGVTCVDETPAACEGTLAPLVTGDDGGGCPMRAGAVYRGKMLGELNGLALFGSACDGLVRAARYDGVRSRADGVVVDVGGAIGGFGSDTAGEVYVLTEAGDVFRLVRPEGVAAPSFPTTLSQTGCYADTTTRAPASGLVPFTVRAPLWTDNARKQRYLAIPDGTTIGYRDADAWDLPVGTLLVKEFLYADDDEDEAALFPMETRLLVKRGATSIEGYSYMWNQERTDAWLLEGGVVGRYDVVEGGAETVHRHGFPSRVECLRCHNAAAGFFLGTVTGRVNTDYDYDGFVDNQLRSMEHIGLFSEPLPAPPAELPKWTEPTDESAPLEDRARAHLAGNCAHCHRPSGPPQTFIDLRYETPFPSQKLCGETPLYGDLGVPGAQVIAPGSAAQSELFLRLARRGAAQMPPLGTSQRDVAAEAIIAAWIDGLGGCP